MKTKVMIVLDKSGSMGKIRAQAVEYFNEEIQQAKLNSDDQNILVSLITFNGNVYEHMWEVKAAEIPELTEQDYIPKGGTALFEAIGYTVDKARNQKEEEGEDIAYRLCIISDGENTDNKKYTIHQIATMIKELEETKNWTFNFVGCDKNYITKFAKQVNIPISNVACFSNNSEKSAKYGFKNMVSRNEGYYSARACGRKAQLNVYSDCDESLADFSIIKDDITTTNNTSPPVKRQALKLQSTNFTKNSVNDNLVTNPFWQNTKIVG